MRYNINLFPPPEQTLLDRLIFFSFHYLRYILVITQLVVLSVFTYRFAVDQDIVDLKDSLKQKQEIITVSSPLLQQVVSTDKKTTIIKSLIKDQSSFSQMLAYYLERFPQDITAQKLSVAPNEIDLQGTAKQISTLQNFYNRLKKENRFKQIELKNVQRTEDGYSFLFNLKNFT